jgi:hypothetical protein
MAEPSPNPAVSTFVLRFWREWSPGSGRWRGRIEHVPSGESAAFLDVRGMLRFLEHFGVEANEQGLRTQDEG